MQQNPLGLWRDLFGQLQQLPSGARNLPRSGRGDTACVPSGARSITAVDPAGRLIGVAAYHGLMQVPATVRADYQQDPLRIDLAGDDLAWLALDETNMPGAGVSSFGKALGECTNSSGYC